MKYIISFAALCIFILIFKIPDTAGLYLTDGNNYLLFAKLLTQGQMLYKDVYLDNFPLMIYISVFYKWLTFGSMQLFNYTTTIEKTIIASLLYYITYKQWKNHSTAFLSAVTFLCSYTTMASSFQLGFFTNVLLILLAYYFVLEKKLLLAGLFAAAAVLAKAYSIFPLFGLLLYVIQEYKIKTWKFVSAGVLTGLIVMLPTIVFAFPQFIEQTLGFGLVRAPSVDKTNLYYLFIVYDFLVCFLVLWNLTLWKKNIFLAAGTASLLLFFALYKDVYYAYFSYFPLLAALGVGYLLETPIPFTKEKMPKAIFATFLVFAAIVGFTTYLDNSRFVKKVGNELQLYQIVQSQKPKALYGHSILVNGVSYYTNIPIYNNMYEITTAYFTNQKMKKEQLTKDLLKTRTLLLLYSYKYDNQILYDETIIDASQLKACNTVYEQLLNTAQDGVEKYVSVVRCY
jgi:hypothetical protein